MHSALISCICISKNNPDFLLRAVVCFKRQSYPNKELVILLEECNRDSIEAMEKELHNTENIKIIIQEHDTENKLGQLRNIAINYASGKYICQWDDDDWYHSNRLQLQYDQLNNFPNTLGCVLTQWVIYDAVTQDAYISIKRNWEGSILCERKIALENLYQNIEKGEDTPLIDFLFKNKKLCFIDTMPYLYIYCYHGNNTWSYEHFNAFMRWSKKLPQIESNIVTSLINEKSETIALQLQIELQEQLKLL